MRVYHAYTRQQSQNHQGQDTYMQTSYLQNQYYTPNPQPDTKTKPTPKLKILVWVWFCITKNLSQRFQDQRHIQYQAAMNQKNVHFGDQINIQASTNNRTNTSQPFSNEGRPSTPQKYTQH